jgi:hypothetical protein
MAAASRNGVAAAKWRLAKWLSAYQAAASNRGGVGIKAWLAQHGVKYGGASKTKQLK